ncbi:Glycosyltransferase involved in cell wall bisynthesis [Succiniclasticum ruminis]|uniref:Glycosyltransferase involved in cell wall bisynthesis n=1 Tax=Succiniclasticum ruminis TaxID=40841 RepID=A0A1G6I304_9FIRM|nr:glycosyltransferase family 2 protein [Succiniclasticum ruminis]SDC00116.1 Glycosyltransferase involved in cell wall bisynthesis [Succiniclasticum ruminis]
MELLYIIAPAYNESDNIRKFIDDWYPIIETYNGNGNSRLVIVNDGSTDNTYEILQECAKTRPLLKPLTKQNGGHGEAVLFGYRYAIDQGADYIFQTDSDGQTDPTEFHRFWNLHHEYDAVIGNRPKRQDGLYRRFVQKVLLLILRMTFGVKIPDSNAPFRLMKSNLVQKYMKKMPKNFNLPNVMLTTYFSYFHERITFVEISFKPRQGGKNSINVNRIVKIGWQALGDFHNLRKHLND